MTLRLRAADAAIPIGAALHYCSRIDGGERARAPAVTSRLIKHPIVVRLRAGGSGRDAVLILGPHVLIWFSAPYLFGVGSFWIFFVETLPMG